MIQVTIKPKSRGGFVHACQRDDFLCLLPRYLPKAHRREAARGNYRIRNNGTRCSECRCAGRAALPQCQTPADSGLRDHAYASKLTVTFGVFPATTTLVCKCDRQLKN